MTRLLADLAGADEARREAAVARLAVIGSRAVDRLLAALGAPGPEAPATAHQVAILQALERIGDARAVDAALGLLDSGPGGLHAAAIGILRSQLHSRRGAVAARVLEALTGILLDRRRPVAVRLAALEAVQDLPDHLTAPLLDQLARDDSPVLRHHTGTRPAARRPRQGGPRAAADFDALLDTLPEDPAAVHDLLAASGADAPLLVLHRLVVAVRAREAACARDADRTAWRLIRAAVHQVLGTRGSRVALYDLRETVATASAPLPIGMLAALVAVGDVTCLEPVADAWQRIDDGWHRERLAEALRAIVAREHLSRRHAVVRKIAARLPDLLAP